MFRCETLLFATVMLASLLIIPPQQASALELTPAMKAFGLHTEPWLFLINPDGTVAYRVEGLVTKDEVSRHMESMLRPK